MMNTSGRKFSEKCLECAKLNPNSYTTRGLLEKLHPDCYVLRRCSRKRGYYRNLDVQRARMRKNHRWIRYKGDKCFVCESKGNLQVHHILTRARGGQDTKRNTMTLCFDCHKVITCYLNRTGQGRETIDEEVKQIR